MKQDKKYRPEVNGPKLPPVTNKPIELGYVKPRPMAPKPVKPGARPGLPMPSDAAAKKQALKRMQEQAAMDRKKSGR
jgi:hypothetical protein